MRKLFLVIIALAITLPACKISHNSEEKKSPHQSESKEVSTPAPNPLPEKPLPLGSCMIIGVSGGVVMINLAQGRRQIVTNLAISGPNGYQICDRSEKHSVALAFGGPKSTFEIAVSGAVELEFKFLNKQSKVLRKGRASEIKVKESDIKDGWIIFQLVAKNN